jgi:hypothetical protein
MDAPEWFLKQFGGTLLDVFPGSITLNYYLIATFEMFVTLGFLGSLIRREFLPGRAKPWLITSLFVAQFVFVALGFGLRLTQDFHGAFELFVYFGATLLIFLHVERVNEKCT